LKINVLLEIFITFTRICITFYHSEKGQDTENQLLQLPRLAAARSAKLKDMAMTFEAVYDNGVLRPLESLTLPNLQHVLVTISGAPASADDVAGYFEPEEWEAAKHDDISLQEVRRALSSITGSLADAVIASREER
jgi:predicted DNA-binding antitoxin AbrB/MazE fold protein